MASADELRAQYEQRRQVAMQRLMALGSARNRYMQEQMAKAEAERLKQEAALKEQQLEGQRNWLNVTGQGAALGMSMGGPWGALIGGGVGLGAGLYGATKAQKGDFGKALANPMGNKFDGMSDIPLAGMVAGGVATGQAIGGPKVQPSFKQNKYYFDAQRDVTDPLATTVGSYQPSGQVNTMHFENDDQARQYNAAVEGYFKDPATTII